MVTKPRTTYSPVLKPRTAYTARPGAADGVTVGDMTVTLASMAVYMNGYLTSVAPDLLPKQRTSYSAIAKPPTAYH